MNAIRWRIHKVYATPPPPPPRLDFQYGIEDISDDEDEKEDNLTNNEKVIRDIMEIYSLDRKGAEEKIDEMAKSAVVKHS